MAFEYQSPPSPGPLRQGELVGPVWDHQPTKPPSELAEGENLPYVSIQHTFLMVMSQDCDLLWDYQARFASDEAKTNLDPQAPEIDAHPSCIPHVLMCDCFPYEVIRARIKGSDIWKRIDRNQDERYHGLPAADVVAHDDDGNDVVLTDLPAIFLDFKKALAIPTRQLYIGLKEQTVPRLAVVPPIYLHDVMHRFYGYHSRVALPEP